MDRANGLMNTSDTNQLIDRYNTELKNKEERKNNVFYTMYIIILSHQYKLQYIIRHNTCYS